MKRFGLCLLGVVVAVSVACKDDGEQQPKQDAAATADSATQRDAAAPDAEQTNKACKAAGKQVVTFTTDDGVKLEADLYLGGRTSGPAAVLLHMVPPSNDRSNYPQAFIDALTKRGITVLNVDRRGAGNSGGTATDAYQGPKGKLDAKAAHDFLKGHACPVDMARLALVGASNGTTTALDFTVYAGAQAALNVPRGLVFLTGGSYTENQNKISANRTLLDTIPILFVYSSVEAAWSAAFKAGGSARWEFVEYTGLTQATGHGTLVFSGKPESIEAVAKFVEKVVKK